MHYGISVGLAVAVGFLAMGSTEAAAQSKSRPIVVKNYYYAAPPTALPPVKYYARPRVKYYGALPVTIYAPPSAAYYAAGPVFTESSTMPRDLPRSSPGYQGSWRNSRF
jgi:hypothetical protein